ncbi:hypothetical protein F4808DRAFT_178489 [Astrocystis sublimbata]|nr:hypothetical protein F4808DRAFT_178489 [Astrocystis sublimbata]
MMARPRKRKRHITALDEASTHLQPSKQEDGSTISPNAVQSRAQHPILSQFYPQIQNLREYVLSKLPPSSRIRRRKVSAVGNASKSPDTPLSDLEQTLGALLDTTLVGLPKPTAQDDRRRDEWEHFSQRGDELYVTISNGEARFAESQALIVEYVVRTLFNRDKSAKWPDHLLCDGFRRNGGLGLRAVRPNPYVEALQQSPWPQLLALLGESGDHIMIDMLLDCAIFMAIDVGTNNICQLSGKSLSNVPLYKSVSTSDTPVTITSSEIVIVRNRMFYAKPALNNRGQVQFGLKHIRMQCRSRPFSLNE